MTAPEERSIDPAEEDRAQVHARIAVRQAVMKGMDREALADAFMIEAVKLTFGVDDAEAARLARRWREKTSRPLGPDSVTHGGTKGRPKSCASCDRSAASA